MSRRLLCVLALLIFPCEATAFAEERPVPSRGAEELAVGGVVCKIRGYTGKPTMFIGGTPRFPMAFASYFPEQFRYRQIAERGIHVYSLSLTLTDKWVNRSKRRVRHATGGIWKGPDNLDFAVVEKRIKEILEVDPGAFIFPRIYCDSPHWWDRLHPDEVRTVYEGRPPRQSFSSLRWRSETAEALKKIVRFVSSSPYGDRVIGYMISAGQTEEWGDQSDYTPCAQKRFREWIWQKYGKDPIAINRLFGKGIESISIPSESERRKGDCGNFLDPEKSRLVIDYRQFHSTEVVDSAIALCRAVKEESGGRLMTGIAYGYTRVWPDWGHLALARLLESDAIDFVCNPFSSGGVKSHLTVGNRDFHNFTETDSVQRAGKLFYCETDIRTCHSRWISQLRPDIDPDGEYNQPGWLGPPAIEKSLDLIKVVFARVLITGSANWWFDLWGGWYDDEKILQLFSRMQKVGDESIHLSRKSVAQIAVVLDEKSFLYHPFGVSQFGGRFGWIESQLHQLGKIGAPYDFYLLDDLKQMDLSRFRMIVFLNAFVLSKDERRMITEKCMSQNRVLLWMYAPGLIKDNLSVRNVSSLLGMEFQMDETHPASKITVTLPGRTVVYQGAKVSPFVYVGNGADKHYGRTPENHLVVAEKVESRCRNAVVSMPPLPREALQHFAKEAGVHLYSEAGDVVYANEHYLAVSAATPGKRTIRLPKRACLKELLGSGIEFETNDEFEIDFAAHTCRLFRVLTSNK